MSPRRRRREAALLLSNGQNRAHPENRWLEPSTPFHATPRTPSYWPTPAQTRLWQNLERVHPILATHYPHRLPDFNHTYPIMAGLFHQQPTRARVIASLRDAAGHFCGRRGRACGRTFNFVVQSVCDVPIINTSYQKLPFGSGDYPDKLLFHQALTKFLKRNMSRQCFVK